MIYGNGAVSRGLKESVKGVYKETEEEEWSLPLNQMEFRAEEQRKVFTKHLWVSVVNGDCHSFPQLSGHLGTRVADVS